MINKPRIKNSTYYCFNLAKKRIMKINGKKLIFLLLLMVSITVYGQKGYDKITEEKGVHFYGKWKLAKKSQKDSPLVLCVLVHNTNRYAVDCTFKITFFDTGLVTEESQEYQLCIKPNKKVKGKKHSLCIVSAELTNEDLKKESFSYEVTQSKIQEVTTCKK